MSTPEWFERLMEPAKVDPTPEQIEYEKEKAVMNEPDRSPVPDKVPVPEPKVVTHPPDTLKLELKLEQVNASRWKVTLKESYQDSVGRGFDNSKEIYTGKKDLCMAFCEGYAKGTGAAIRY